MFFTFLTYCFKWLPTPLFLLVSAVFTVFAVIVAVEILKLIYALVGVLCKGSRRTSEKGGGALCLI